MLKVNSIPTTKLYNNPLSSKSAANSLNANTWTEQEFRSFYADCLRRAEKTGAASVNPIVDAGNKIAYLYSLVTQKVAPEDTKRIKGSLVNLSA